MPNTDLLRRAKTDQERRGNLPSSVKKRALCLRAFATYLGGRSLLEATREDIEVFLDARKLTAGTRYGWVSHIHCFYVWAIDEELTTTDPTARIHRPKLRRYLPRPAATDQLIEAFKYGDPILRCWIALAAFQGLRVQEIAGLDRQDVDFAEGRLRVVHGKGAKERMLDLHPDAAEALICLPVPKSGRVFQRPRGGGYSPAELSRVFNLRLEEYGVEATAHQLRHWFATELYAATRDLRITQEAMGHSSAQTTSVYVGFSNEAMRTGIHALTLDGAA